MVLHEISLRNLEPAIIQGLKHSEGVRVIRNPHQHCYRLVLDEIDPLIQYVALIRRRIWVNDGLYSL